MWNRLPLNWKHGSFVQFIRLWPCGLSGAKVWTCLAVYGELGTVVNITYLPTAPPNNNFTGGGAKQRRLHNCATVMVMGLRAAREMFLSNISHIEILFVILRRQQTGELTKSANFCSIIKTEGAVCSDWDESHSTNFSKYWPFKKSKDKNIYARKK